MSLADDKAAGPAKPRVAGGVIPNWLASLDDTERDAALAMIEDPAWGHLPLLDRFRRHGLVVSGARFSAWRKEHVARR